MKLQDGCSAFVNLIKSKIMIVKFIKWRAQMVGEASVIIALLANFSYLYAGQLKIVTYNILNFPEALGWQRLDDFRVVFDYLKPDVIAVQEMQSQFGVDLFCDSVLNYQSPDFSAFPFNDGYDTDNALFYRHEKVEALGAEYILTTNRDIAKYSLRFKESQKDFLIFSCHFKAAQGSENEQIRLQEATTLRNYLDSIGYNKDFLVMGDFNFYYDEPGFRKLIDSIETTTGRLFDPLNSIGTWHDNSEFVAVHTQSSRLDALADGGASGGLDDRFDMILCSKSLLDSASLYLPKSSYTTVGNDGRRFNKSVNYGINQAVPDNVADALYYASDHLPVMVSIFDDFGNEIAEKQTLMIYPNPLETSSQIKFPYLEDFEKAELTITNVLGQRLFETETKNPVGITIRRNNLGVGIYFVHVAIETKYARHYYRSKLAVVK